MKSILKLMIRVFILILLILQNPALNGQNSVKNEIDFQNILSEVKWFIEKVKPESISKGINNVYLVKIYYGDSPEKYCVTIGYISCGNSSYLVLKFKYYILLNDELILLDYSEDLQANYLFKNVDDIHLLNDTKIAFQRMDMEATCLGYHPGYVCCYKQNCIIKTYYYNGDEIPLNQSFERRTPESNDIIELDSCTFKEIIKNGDFP